MSELRWNRLLNEWIITATDRQERTFLPPPEYCPLCPTAQGGTLTEVPSPSYGIAVLQNRFPSLTSPPPSPAIEDDAFFKVAPAEGVCEVVLYTQEHNATLADLPQSRIRNLIDVWTDRFEALSNLPNVRCVFIFENKGEEIGVTLNHPHGQIYAYPFVPPRIAAEIAAFDEYAAQTDRCLLCDDREREVADGRRVVLASSAFSAFVPFASRWPYEIHVVSNRHAASLADLTEQECDDLAYVLKRVLTAYDALFERSFPYVMAFHQAPVPHFHIEFYPPLREAARLKYLAGSELGAGAFINDTLPERTAASLRDALQRARTE